MYWANSRRITAVQRSYAGFGEREKVEEKAREVRLSDGTFYRGLVRLARALSNTDSKDPDSH